MTPTLDEIGLLHGTDKASINGHNYLSYYDLFLSPLRYKQITFVEIGVLSGQSLRTWRDYFPNGRIIGLDINPDCKAQEDDRIEVVIGNQNDPASLDYLLSLHPDVVNDDACHAPDAQLFTYQYMLPRMAPGSIYILEDIWHQPVAELLSEIACCLVYYTTLGVRAQDQFIQDIAPKIRSMAFCREACITWLR